MESTLHPSLDASSAQRNRPLIGGRARAARASERSGPCPLFTTVGRSLLPFCSKANLIGKREREQ